MTVAAPTSRSAGERYRRLEVAAFALLAYVPFLVSSPGRVTADTKQYLYLDPGRLLARAPYLWDEHIGFGSVSHQIIGYLFPMGPFYWVTSNLALPDWVGQRFWLGSISLAAALGARWLFRMLGTGRAGAIGGALVYMLTPYQLAFTARISVLLLAWAGLPWLIGLSMRAVRRQGWREPALFALVVLTIGSVNASSLLFVGLGPALWLVLESTRGRTAFGAVVRATARMAVLTLGVCLWWIVGLRIQGKYGLPVLQLTETVRTVAADSNPLDIVRGIGNWYFYGRDRLGFSIDQASAYRNDRLVIAATYAIPLLALTAAAITRWKHRTYFVLLVVVGTVISVGAWPYDDPSAYGELFKSFAGTSAGLALRNTPRAVPLLVLGMAGLIGAGIPVVARRFGDVWPTVLVGVLACAALTPVGAHGFLSRHLDRPEEVPEYWKEAIAAMAREGDATRVLEIPGSDFAAYRWGNTIEPITPGLTDRPYVARETLPTGTAASVDFLDALDRRIQEGTLDPDALAGYARLAGVGTIALRSDLEYERFDTPRPRNLWSFLTDPVPEGLRSPKEFGTAARNAPPASFPADDPRDLGIPRNAADPPPVALFDVEDAVPIVHSAPVRQPVLLDGDADGIVDAISAGLVDGRSLVLEAAALTPAQLRAQLRVGADLVLTDSNRRRNQQFFAGVRDNDGYTERAGETFSPDEFRLDPFPGSTDDARTVVEQEGGTVDATGYTIASNRPSRAVDGDPTTSWLVSDPVGQRITIHADAPQTIDRVTLTQPLAHPLDRSIAAVTLSFDDGATVQAALDPSSTTAAGQTISFPQRTTTDLTIRIDALLQPSDRRNAVGLSAVGFGDVRIQEVVRLPVDLAHAVGDAASGHRLDVVLSRLRNDRSTRDDEETTLRRRFVTPDDRSYVLTGTATVDPNAADTAIDDALGTVSPGTQYTASSHLAGDADARASRAFDHDRATAWTPSLADPAGNFLQVSLPAAKTVDRMDLTFADDTKHFVPTQVTLVADGQPARTLTIPERRGIRDDGSLRTVELDFDPVTASDLKVVFDRTAASNDRIQPVVLPISIAEVGLDVPAPSSPTTIDTGCRNDLLQIDGRSLPTRIQGPARSAERGLEVTLCEPSIGLDAGSHTLESTPSTFDVDQVVLSSNRAGEATEPTPAGAPLRTSGARVRITESDADSYQLKVRTDGRPFWLVLGQSHSDGWEATVDGATLGAPTLVNGFANGWVVRPGEAGTVDVSLRWTPQRQVWVGIGVSALAIVLCVVLVVRTRRHRSVPLGLHELPRPASPWRFEGDSPGIGVALATALASACVTGFVSRWWIGGLVGLATLAAELRGQLRGLLAVGAPVALALAALLGIDALAWVAVSLLVGDLLAGWCRGRVSSRDRGPEQAAGSLER